MALFACTAAEIKLLLRLRQLAREGKARQVLYDFAAGELLVLGKPERLGQNDTARELEQVREEVV